MPRDEKEPASHVEPQARADPRLPPAHALSRRTEDPGSTSTKRALAPHPELIQTPPQKQPLKLSQRFTAVYRRGRWAHGPTLSVGILPNGQRATRIGLRTRRGLKGAVERNRLKRQLRTATYAEGLRLRGGLDLVIVIHPKTLPAMTERMREELCALCRRTGALQA